MFRHTEDETTLHGGRPLLGRGHPSALIALMFRHTEDERHCMVAGLSSGVGIQVQVIRTGCLGV